MIGMFFLWRCFAWLWLYSVCPISMPWAMSTPLLATAQHVLYTGPFVASVTVVLESGMQELEMPQSSGSGVRYGQGGERNRGESRKKEAKVGLHIGSAGWFANPARLIHANLRVATNQWPRKWRMG